MADENVIVARINARRHEIAALRADVAAQIEQLKRVDSGLEQEEAELKITERHIAKLTQGELERPMTELGARVMAASKAQEAAQRGKRKPDGVPSVLAMAGTVLLEKAERGQIWLEPAEFVTEIKKRWWPEAEQAFIAPQLWRAFKKGTLRKDGTRYALPEGIEKAPASVAAGAPQSNGAAGWYPVST